MKTGRKERQSKAGASAGGDIPLEKASILHRAGAQVQYSPLLWLIIPSDLSARQNCALRIPSTSSRGDSTGLIWSSSPTESPVPDRRWGRRGGGVTGGRVLHTVTTYPARPHGSWGVANATLPLGGHVLSPLACGSPVPRQQEPSPMQKREQMKQNQTKWKYTLIVFFRLALSFHCPASDSLNSCSDVFFFFSSSVKRLVFKTFLPWTWAFTGQHLLLCPTPGYWLLFNAAARIFSVSFLPRKDPSTSHMIICCVAGFDSRTPTVLIYVQLDFKKLEVLHATFGIFSSPRLWVLIGVHF